MYRADTIVACATPPGRGAVAIIRLSGPQAFEIVQRLFHPSTASPIEPWKLRHGQIIDDARGREIDEALAVLMPAPKSYTGEDVCEIQCHGSPVVTERILSLAVSSGARAAEPGEFTRRAFLNGRIDLLQAEAVADLIDSRSGGGAAMAWAQLQGALSSRLESIRERIKGVLADVEANVDFCDDDLPEEDDGSRTGAIAQAVSDIDELLESSTVGRRYREGVRVVLVGRPNVGKSSLVNALLGHARMIVSDEPGTTRDTVEETLEVGGLAVVITDTAGLRAAQLKAEAAAVERARDTLDYADIVLAVFDGSAPLGTEDDEVLAEIQGRPALVAINKCDLPRELNEVDEARLREAAGACVSVSALTGSGCDEVLGALAAMLTAAGGVPPVALSRVRHVRALEAARRDLAAAAELLGSDAAAELAAFELRAALSRLADVVAPLDNEELLDVIFKEFCIGK